MGTFELKAKVAPERQSEWKVIFEFCRFSFLSKSVNFFLSLESVRGIQLKRGREEHC